jgi:hypothetical protein
VGEVWCVATGEEKTLTEWVSAKHDRYLVWAGMPMLKSHPRIMHAEDNELLLQQIVAQLLYLPFVYDDPSHPILIKLARIQTEAHYQASDFIDQGVKLLSNYRANLKYPTALASEWFGKLSEYPAIVCGAGPSLQEIFPKLKEHRNRFLIIGCGAGTSALLAAGIEPHLAVHVDPDPYHKFTKTKIPLFYQLRTSFEVVSQMKGPHYLMSGSGEFPLERWIEEKLGLESSTDGGWTAATRGASLAVSLGCKNIYLAGIDFSTSHSMYASGVKPPADEGMIEIELSNGVKARTRPDWLLAAQWLNEWATNHPQHTWGFFSKPNPLMPSIPAVDFNACLGPEHKLIFTPQQEISGKEVWNEISASFSKCRTLVEEFISHFQTIFPKPPKDETCLKILEQINHQLAVRLILDPIWNHWEVVLSREPDSHPDALIVHRILLLKTLADQFYV